MTPVTSFNDNTLASMQNNTQASPIFQFDAAGQGQTFVAARYTSTVVPWTYYLLKPLTTVTGLADQQLLSVFLIVSIVLLLAVVIGVLAGRRIAITQNERGCCMQHIYKRREAIKIGLGSLAGLSTLGLVSCSSTEDAISPNQGNVAMNLVFWGTATRNTATRQAISLFQQRYANVSIASSTPRLTITGPCSINWLLPVRHRNSCRWTCGMLPDMPEAN